MINHVRTLLLNQPGRPAEPRDTPGEEYVPADYVPRELPRFLKTAWQAVFGSAPDRIYRNYRLYQMMQLLHATELDEHVRSFDPRITYVVDDTSFYNSVFGLRATQLAGTPCVLHGFGEHKADDGAGRLKQHWELSVAASALAEVRRLTPPTTVAETPFSITDGLTSEIALPGAGLHVRISQPVVGATWEVVSYARPQLELCEALPAFANLLGSAGLGAVFGDSADEPAATWRQLWDTHGQFAYCYGALLLAVAAYTDKLPQQQGVV